jgi:hypothetical protein
MVLIAIKFQREIHHDTSSDAQDAPGNRRLFVQIAGGRRPGEPGPAVKE